MAKINKKVLLFSTYPIANAQHGGQKRVAAIVQEYQKVFAGVKFMAVFHQGFYPIWGKEDVYVTGSARQQVEGSPFTGDVICGEAIYDEPRVRKKVEKLLRSFRPDIIEIEQPFPYLGLKPLLDDLGMHPKIVLNSQNLEYAMKEEMLESLGMAAKDRKKIVAKIRDIEESATKAADLVIAVTPADAEAHIAMGAKKTVIASNGIAKVTASQAAVNYWQDFKRKHAVKNLVTFVGSAHPPNWFGFLDMVGDRIGFVPPDARIVLAGSISDYFEQSIREQKPEHVTFWHRVFAAGRLSDDRLAALIETSDVLLLPITEGGGSNLKTAEAILSGKKIVTTSYGLRSFEHYKSFPNIYIADTPSDFRKAILRAIHEPYVPRTKAQIKQAEEVQWEYCLQPMVAEVSKL